MLCLYPLNYKNIKFRNKRYDGQYLYVFVTFLILCIIAGLRAKNVGTDTLTYFDIYRKVSYSNSFTQALRVSTINSAPLYVIYMYVASKLGLGYQAILIINSVVIEYGFYRYIKRTSNNFGLSTLLFFTLSLYFESMNGMRQFMSIAIMLNSYLCIKKKFTSIKGWFLFFAAVFIHNSAIVFLLTIVGDKLSENQYIAKNITKYSLLSSVAIIFIYGFIVSVVTQIFPGFAQYVNGENRSQFMFSQGAGRIVFLYLILLIVLLLFWYKLRNNKLLFKKLRYFEYPSLWFCVISGIIFSKNILYNRILWYFLALFISFIPNSLYLYKKNHRIFLAVIIVSITIIYSLFHLVEDKSGIIPYYFFWQLP